MWQAQANQQKGYWTEVSVGQVSDSWHLRSAIDPFRLSQLVLFLLTTDMKIIDITNVVGMTSDVGDNQIASYSKVGHPLRGLSHF